MKEASVEVSDIRLQLATMLKQKSRNNWLLEGASNTSFFHTSINIHRRSNIISELVNDNGVTITDYDQIRDLAVNYFENKFNGDSSIPVDSLFDVDHASISVEESTRMDQFPTQEEIHEAVFNLGADSALGPDGFAGFFYRHCWEIIRDDLGVNLSLLLLFPKERGANTLKNFRPIGLSNFFFKIFTKILATRLGSVLGNLVSEEQVSFMKGINIHENISLASEMVNELQIKRKEGNVGLKLDITQDFDTGDPLSPLIFVLIEDVLSRNITKLFPEGKHEKFEESGSSLNSYQRASCQTVSREKSKLYYGGGSLWRRATISGFLGMNVVTFPDRYVGVKVMSGDVKYHHVSNVVEKIKDQLSSWKGRMLSFQVRVVLVKSVIVSYSIHNMAVYKWPRKFIHQCEVAIRNFVWSGDSQVSISFMVAYNKVYAPYNEDGLGITQMRVMNKAILMKLCWNICSSKKAWAGYLRAKFFKKSGQLVGYRKSSIFPGFKWVYNEVNVNTKVLSGDGRATSLYFDSWCEETCIVNAIGPENLDHNLLVVDCIQNGEWILTELVTQKCLQMV
ncbi:uncharacterized protein LOC113355467 [Papaver somniferum]|uniref:uncharacterized protein LOC113355467 n=1 Tax=Papaver somniferum TaxID=3469 RepID=UPI000E700101|nr:uncharacterized protein LOC113355467 [Papaver somniferum]